MKSIKFNFDGACEPKNPGGNMGFGVLIRDESTGDTIYQETGFEPAAPGNTNNIAEYKALLNGLNWLLENGYQNDRVNVFGDSMLVIQQMLGNWAAKKGAYIPFFQQAIQLSLNFSNITFTWIPREQNQEADSLSKAVV